MLVSVAQSLEDVSDWRCQTLHWQRGGGVSKKKKEEEEAEEEEEEEENKAKNKGHLETCERHR